MNKEQIKQEAKERVKEHLILVLIVDLEEATVQAKKHALKGIQKEVDLLEELAFSENRIRNVSAFKILNTKLNNLKQVKTEIEKL
jgi:hypothetical protein